MTISRQGIQPIAKKVEAILAIDRPKTKKQLRGFIGMVNFYRDMWPKRSELLAPLSSMTSSTTKFKWTEEHDKSFKEMKKIMARETLLAFPDFNKPFDIHTDASKLQLGSIISQEGRPIAFYSRKLNPAQTRYTTTERELLSIVETFKEFRNILLGQQIIVHTDHQNLIYNNLTSERVMRWRLYLEEYSPEIKYIKGEINEAADALSRLPRIFNKLPKLNSPEMAEVLTIEEMSDHFCYNNEPNTEIIPITYREIKNNQQSEEHLTKMLEYPDPIVKPKYFHGGGTSYKLYVKNNKIYVPRALQYRTIKWYHDMLCHPGQKRMEETIGQHLWWPKMREQIRDLVRRCDICQRTKRKPLKYGLLPPKQAEAKPWDVLCVDLIGPYKIKRKGKEDLVLKAVTMIDPATGCTMSSPI